jgi:hypothetical protein
VKNSVGHKSIVRIIVAVAFTATAAMAGGCVMDASPEPTPSTGSNTSEVDRSVHAPTGVAIAPAPVSQQQLAPALQGALGPVDNTVNAPATPALPRIVSPSDGPPIEDPGGMVEDGPRPHPWEPGPEDSSDKPKIGGGDQSESTPSTGK